MNPNDVEIVRVYTREFNGRIADITPHVSLSAGGTFDVVVEAEAGSVQAVNSAEWKISIEAFDLTTGNHAGPKFHQSNTGHFSGGPFPGGWPVHQEVFHINLTPAEGAALQDHILQCVAYVKTPAAGVPLITSIAESPLFIVSATD